MLRQLPSWAGKASSRGQNVYPFIKQLLEVREIDASVLLVFQVSILLLEFFGNMLHPPFSDFGDDIMAV